MLSPAQLNQEKRYCLFCHDFESEEAEGFFLDDEKLVGFYPTIRNVIFFLFLQFYLT